MRKRRATKRDVLADPIYNSKVVTKLVNHIMKDGKKGTAQNIIYDAFDIVKEKTGEEAMVVFEKAMNNIKPALEVKSRRVCRHWVRLPSIILSSLRLLLHRGWRVVCWFLSLTLP